MQAVRIYSQDTEIESGTEKCAMLIMKGGKRQITEWIELPNQERIRTVAEKETYLGILEADTIWKMEMKETLKKSISREQESCSKPNYKGEYSSNV